MWTCKQCGEKHEETFESCWNCGLAKEGIPGQVVAEEVRYRTGRRLMNCLRCQTVLELAGLQWFKKVFAWQDSALDRQHQFEVYVCPSCGKVEMYLQGIGVV